MSKRNSRRCSLSAGITAWVVLMCSSIKRWPLMITNASLPLLNAKHIGIAKPNAFEKKLSVTRQFAPISTCHVFTVAKTYSAWVLFNTNKPNAKEPTIAKSVGWQCRKRRPKNQPTIALHLSQDILRTCLIAKITLSKCSRKKLSGKINS